MLRYIASAAKIFSAKPNFSSRNRSYSLRQYQYEDLEQRRVLAGISFDVSSGFLTILGGNGNDASTVTHPTNASQIEVKLSGFTPRTFTTSQVNRIFFIGLDGDDFFRNQTTIPASVEGGAGNDRLVGGFGNDELFGNEGDDTINGEDGNDLIEGGSGNDLLIAGSGNDRVYGNEGNDTINGVFGTNQIWGGSGDDKINGGALDDQIWGEDGNDTINTGEGNNFVDGGDGNDVINSASATSNIILGGNGNDQIFSGNATSRLEGGNGDDILIGGNGIDAIFGQEGNDTLRGGALNDFLDGGNGNDSLFGADGDDELVGGENDDRLFGGNGKDRMRGEGGNDELTGNEGDDEIYGQDGDDTIYAGNGNDVVRAGAGNDKVYGQGGNDELFGQDGNDILNGGVGNDILHGQEGDDRILGDEGDDRLYGYNGNDSLIGGNGHDGLFGGINGTKQLFGGNGKDRFLLAATATNQISGLAPEDAQIQFRNGLRTWSNVEITVVDAAFHDIHMRVGNTRMLKPTQTDRPVVFIKEQTLNSNRFGANELVTIQRNVVDPITRQVGIQTYREHQIRLPEWDEFNTATNLSVRAEVAREIAYNWASDAAMLEVDRTLAGIFPRFANISGWTNTEPPQTLLDEYYKSQDNQWWYFRVGQFTESYSTYNPAADFTACFKYYFDPRVNPAERVTHITKLRILDELFAKLAPL